MDLNEGEIFVHVDLHGENRVAWGRTQFGFLHLVIEEVYHQILSDSKRNIPYVQPVVYRQRCDFVVGV